MVDVDIIVGSVIELCCYPLEVYVHVLDGKITVRPLNALHIHIGGQL